MERHWAARILAIAAAGVGGACGGVTSSEGGAGRDAGKADAKEEGGKDAGGAPAPDAPLDVAADAVVPDVLSARRPFLVGASLRTAVRAARDDWSDALPPVEGLCAALLGALAEAWLRDALEEHASVAAFARFAMSLLGVGAPPDLVAGAHRAALDEVRHARACFSLARRYGAVGRGPSALRVDDAMGPATLLDLAALTAAEGCVGETLGACVARAQAERAADPVVKPLLRRLAADEARHAELAWRSLAWAVGAGGAPVLAAAEDAAQGAIAATLAMELRPLLVDPVAWAAHGRLPCLEVRAVADQACRDVVQPALAALRAGARVWPLARSAHRREGGQGKQADIWKK